MVIESIDNKKIKNIRKLNKKKYRDETKTFLVEGPHLVNEAYNAGLLKEVILEENEKININVKTTYVTYNVIKSISELDTPYKVIGICNYMSEKQINGNVLILDDIQDPGNLGTIIRSAVAFNIDTILLSKNAVDVYNFKVLRGAQGLNFHINIVRCDIEKEVNNLKNKGYTIYSTDVVTGKNIKNVKVSGKYGIIMGNEGRGVKESLKEISDEKLYIKMNEKCESLNVAVATSIILYELS